MADNVRERKPANGHANGGPVGSQPTKLQPPRTSQDPKRGLSIIDVFRILAGLLLLNALLSYFITNDSFLWGWRPWFVRPRVLLRYWQGPIHLTDAQLTAYDGTDPTLPIYLALNGTIYDVTAGRRLYGPEGGYHVFAGKDAARGFITGCFAEDSTPDLRGAEWTYIPQSIPGWEVEGVGREMKVEREKEVRKAKRKVRETLEGWARMFAGEVGGKEYFEVGEVVREVGWLEGLPRRTLCAQAEKGRPKAKGKARDEGAAYRPG